MKGDGSSNPTRVYSCPHILTRAKDSGIVKTLTTSRPTVFFRFCLDKMLRWIVGRGRALMGKILPDLAQHEGMNEPQVDAVTNMIETYWHCLRRSAALNS